MSRGDDYNLGLYRKFHVERTDGQSAPGKRHDNCQYFVLDVDHDQFAGAALRAYRDECAHEFPKLAADIDKLLNGETVFLEEKS